MCANTLRDSCLRMGSDILQSGIHGWGLIARTEMKQDSMVVEYRGDLLRPKMSEDRQKHYNRIGKDCYLFNVNDDVIIDATMTGAVGRFTVSCHPLPVSAKLVGCQNVCCKVPAVGARLLYGSLLVAPKASMAHGLLSCRSPQEMQRTILTRCCTQDVSLSSTCDLQFNMQLAVSGAVAVYCICPYCYLSFIVW